MVVPDYQSIMLPLLELLSGGKVHRLREVIDSLGEQLNLSEDEKKEVLPSGRQAKFANRVSWARTYMGKAGLLVSMGRGKFRITDRGLAVLNDYPPEINVNFLNRFPEFLEFKGVSNKVDTSEKNDDENYTPEEILEFSYQNLRTKLSRDLLEQIMSCSPQFFENLVVDLLVAMGYGGSKKDAGQAIGKTGDGGIDGIIKEDKLGLDVIYIQAKRWEGTVGRPVVQAFAGSLMGLNARKGVLITTSHFSREAKDYVVSLPNTKIVLIDGQELAQFMIDHGIGVAKEARYEVKRLDLDYFGED